MKSIRTHLSSPWASFAAIVLALFWTIPTLGLFVTSFRPSKGINTSGWWTVFTNPEFTLTNYSRVLFEGRGATPPLSQYFLNTFAIVIPSTIIPITIAIFAAYAIAWFDFKGRNVLFFTIFALLVAMLDIGILFYAWKTQNLTVGSVVALIALIENAYTPIAIFNVLYVQYKLDKPSIIFRSSYWNDKFLIAIFPTFVFISLPFLN